VQQKQDIKGFTLLELLVVISIILVISAVGFPRFMDWKKDREVRVASENIVSMISGIVSQSKRGSFPFVQFNVRVVDGSDTKTFTTRGLSQKSFTSKRSSITCDSSSSYWDKDKVHLHITDIRVHIAKSGAVCFSKDSSFFIYSGDLSTKSTNVDGVKSSDFIIICDLQQLDENGISQLDKNNTCKLNPEKPAYLVKWTRFGTVTKYKWSGSAWNLQ
tara:strand:- start:3204 stop:3854 length:651 start_codon:yes stop_codon:yes gene_type:complete